jgi:hypothetical protein
MMLLSTLASTAATIENPIIHLKVRNAILPVPAPAIDPVATMTEAITSGTIDIWISRMNRSPMNFRFAAHSPTTNPNTMPPIAARPICAAGCASFFMDRNARSVSSQRRVIVVSRV